MANDDPFLQAAVVCEHVLAEQDGAISAIRIIDRVFFALDEAGQPINPRYPVYFFISFRAGPARGSYPISVRREKPSGEDSDVFEVPVLFEADERSVNIIVKGEFEPDQAGLYWFDVLFDGERVTRIPLRAVFQSAVRVGPGG